MVITVNIDAHQAVAEVRGCPELRVTAASEAEALEALAARLRQRELDEDAHDITLLNERLASPAATVAWKDLKAELGL